MGVRSEKWEGKVFGFTIEDIELAARRVMFHECVMRSIKV